MFKSFDHYLKILLFTIVICFEIGCSPKLSNSKKNYTDSSIESGSDILNNIYQKQTLRVGTTGDFKPFSYIIDSTGNYTGIDIKMGKDLAKSLGVKVEFIETSWPTLMSDLMENKFDIGMCGITITPERKKTSFFSIPVYSSGKAAITRDENALKYNSIEKINNKEVRVIFNPGGTNEAFARANFPEATLILNEDNLSIFQKLVVNEADVMVTDAIETLIQQQIHKELAAVNPNAPFNSFDFGYLLPKDSIFKTVVDNWLLEKKKDSLLIKLLHKEINKHQ
ncbi:cyclohexadienyl dehydratase [Maribacter spongiicola]|uniref:Cyclohexadienyl dehydratase n=1 Tax=Maribacter spongiicola TaxID=1206753 RepID=A0A4V3ERR1_9FLAO|nr:transporter substrate-binding domain-containing protein [Maribacter spongiicola]TDT47113.1 cyclohexadienyl dehydratase [Maribacter spongiicola]